MAEKGDHGGQPEPRKNKGPSEGPSGYMGTATPTSEELAAPTKIYPGASKLPRTPEKGLIEGPCSEHQGYHK